MTDEKDTEDNQPWHRRLIDVAKDMAIEEAIDSVVSEVSGGWLSYESDDDDDARPAEKQTAQRETFEQRLERELGRLPKDAERSLTESALPASVSRAFDESIERELQRLAAEKEQQVATPQPVQPVQATQPFRPAASPLGFGRKLA